MIANRLGISLFFLCVCICIYVRLPCVRLVPSETRKGHQIPWRSELESQVVVNCLIGLLGARLGSSIKTQMLTGGVGHAFNPL